MFLFFKYENQSISPKDNYSVPTTNPQYMQKVQDNALGKTILRQSLNFYISYSLKIPKRKETEISLKIRNLKVRKSSYNFKRSYS